MMDISTDKYRRQISEGTIHISNIAATTTTSNNMLLVDESNNTTTSDSLALTGLTSYQYQRSRHSLNSSFDDTNTTSTSETDQISINQYNDNNNSFISTLTPASPLTISASTFNDSAISNISIDKQQDGLVSCYDKQKQWLELDNLDDKTKKLMRKDEIVRSEGVVVVSDGGGGEKRVVTVKQSGELKNYIHMRCLFFYGCI